MVYGYARVSTMKQKLQRQIDNIVAFDKSAIIFTEKYTGTKLDGREELEKLLRKVKPGDTIIFDSVSRMSRNADEGIKLYFELFNKGISLIFLKERYIDTEVYSKAIQKKIDISVNSGKQSVDKLLTSTIENFNEFFIDLAIEQIKIAFDQAEKEVADLRQRVKEGIAKSDKKQGTKPGTIIATKKSVAMKEKMQRHLIEFGGTDTDIQFMKDNSLARNTFYKYKRELKAL